MTPETIKAWSELAKVTVPVLLALIGVLRNRTDIDRLAPLIRGGKMRNRWYHWLKPTRKRKKKVPADVTTDPGSSDR